jgi:hypothetical protein
MCFSRFVEEWWPLPTSLDLVRGSDDVVASAVHAEIARFVRGSQLSSEWTSFNSISEIFGSVVDFTNTPTLFFVLPTQSEWTVLWNNSFLCNGYDSLCWCLTENHGFPTIHWQSSKEDCVFQAGSLFTARRLSSTGIVERSVYCCKNDSRWYFEARGEPLPEEEVEAYAARSIRTRLDEEKFMALLSRLGAHPWQDSFYRPGQAFRLERVAFPTTLVHKQFADFAKKH